MKALDFMDRKADGTPRKKHRLLILLCLLIFIALLIPQGGEIYEPDFLLGYDVYVRPSYVVSESATPQKWAITDKATEKAIFRLCQKMDTYQAKDMTEILLGGVFDGLQMDHMIYLAAGKYCYIIRPMEWENGINAQEEVADEMYGKPLLEVNRFSLWGKDADTDLFSYLKSANLEETIGLNSTMSWYSSLNQEEFDDLLALLETVGEENAELID